MTGSVGDLAFYCVTGRDFFPGAVAMINSIRLQGHGEPVFVLDCGMTRAQRAKLASHATLVTAPSGAAPSTLKLVVPRARPAGTMVLLDSDLIATRPLTELIEPARSGRLAAFENDGDRYFVEWSALLDLPPVRRGPYFTSSAVAIGGAIAARLLPLVADRQRAIPERRTWVGGGDPGDPLFFFDQDVLNAAARSVLDPDQLVTLPPRLAPIPPFAGVRVVNGRALRCKLAGGGEPAVLHHASRKPWLVPVRTNPYSRLLTRLLLAEDVPIRLEPGELPLRLRTGAAATAARLRTDALLTAPGIARRLRRRPRPVPAWPN